MPPMGSPPTPFKKIFFFNVSSLVLVCWRQWFRRDVRPEWGGSLHPQDAPLEAAQSGGSECQPWGRPAGSQLWAVGEFLKPPGQLPSQDRRLTAPTW